MEHRLSLHERETLAFLRMAALEMRRLAECAPDIAEALLHIASQLKAEADDLKRRDAG